ncbi:helix-turn-helix transcriptional regulator [Pantoea ananatis]|uniref:helix-turn-helix transcriptional regulator n=2 Tax=Pantoea ananas TaxID=553 RepID=UPI00040FB5C6|nr:AlpA family phage regulatory protein [Pantoea ananatis]MDQ1226507.1 putative DNA-binding transcriptional regulator AlpA [Pantoea ananatis]MDR6088385.1 putative DNA-binding transcriptional regulator AlpA [Pantoea ananatis]PVY85618.1 AlpA family transcriptional regulator [Pantoea ananatis]
MNIEMISEKKIMETLGISSRQTMAKYIKKYNFPQPVTVYPKQFLQAEVEKWILNGGVNQKVS